MAYSGLFLSNNGLQLSDESGKLLRDCLPHDVYVNVEVGEDQTVADSNHSAQRKVGVFFAKGLACPARGFSNYLERADQQALEGTVAFKVALGLGGAMPHGFVAGIQHVAHARVVGIKQHTAPRPSE